MGVCVLDFIQQKYVMNLSAAVSYHSFECIFVINSLKLEPSTLPQH